MPSMTDPRQRWALILGSSSGFGEATALALAADGYDICGAHLDRRQGQAHVDEIKSKITALGRQALFINGNAADDEQRASVIAELKGAIGDGYVRVMLHSLAFGTLKPFLAEDPEAAINRRNLEMTLDVMANSLVYWTQDVWRAGLLAEGSKIYALTSEGSTRADCELRRGWCRQGGARVALPPAGDGVRAARQRHHRERDPRRA